MSIEIARAESIRNSRNNNVLGDRSPAHRETGLPLSALGKRIEMLRIERGLPKQLLARRAGASRQQLWRVMTGKSELTSTLGARLAEVLQVEPAALTARDGSGAPSTLAATRTTSPTSLQLSLPFCEYVHDIGAMERTLRTIPTGADGIRLKRALLSEMEEAASAADIRLSARFYALRRRVLNGEI